MREILSVSRQTVWRACRGLEPVPPTPAPAPAPASLGPVDLEVARDPSVSACCWTGRRTWSLCRRLRAACSSRPASAEIRADKCVNHLPVEDVIQASLKIQYRSLDSGIYKGLSFQRRLLMEYEDLDPGQLDNIIIDDAIDGR